LAEGFGPGQSQVWFANAWDPDELGRRFRKCNFTNKPIRIDSDREALRRPFRSVLGHVPIRRKQLQTARESTSDLSFVGCTARTPPLHKSSPITKHHITTPDVVQTVQRIFSVFPAEQQNHVVQQLANSLQAVLCQRLLPKAGGGGRTLATEFCVVTSGIRNRIRDMEAHHIYSEMQVGAKRGMHTMDKCLLELYQRGEITYDVAVSNAREPDAIKARSA
jgi:hypothetical protein